MKVDHIRKILIVQSVEETDEHDSAISGPDRADAAAIAGAPIPKNCSPSDENAFLAKRADILFLKITSRFSENNSWLHSSPSPHRLAFITFAVFAIAAICGFLTNELGPDKRINILSFPLLGILGWSLIVYIREIILFFQKRDQLFRDGWLAALIHFAIHPTRRQISSDNSPPDSLSSANTLFQHRWFELMTPVHGSRLKSVLHFAALILAASAILGMYFNGLANEYRAVWESTFFSDAGQLRPFLKFVLGPAAAMTGDAIPTISELASMRWTVGQSDSPGENAARWIHWYAVTIGLFVILPRGVLGVIWKLKSLQLSRTLPYRETSPHYYEHLLAISSGTAKPVFIIPYILDPSNELRELTNSLEHHFQCPVEIDCLDTIPFGKEDLEPNVTVAENNSVIPLFNFASTPEQETHLALYQTLLDASPNPVKFILLDPTSFDKKAAGFADSEKQRADRLEAWQRLFSDTDVEFILTPVSSSTPNNPGLS
tara:strand:+ start:3160 stop:4623 length:1464 start_codon:yes stop_codon:yes gene_type:complete